MGARFVGLERSRSIRDGFISAAGNHKGLGSFLFLFRFRRLLDIYIYIHTYVFSMKSTNRNPPLRD